MATYTVKSGDTLSAIGASYGVPYQKITGFKSGNPNLIYPGEVLTIPDAGGSAPAPTQTTPKTQEEVTPFLNEYQQNLLKTTQAPEVRVPTIEELKTTLAPTVTAPEPLKRVEELAKLRTTYGVSDLETTLSALKKQEQDEMANLRTQRGIEEGKPVPMGVIAGRIGEEERVAQQRMDAITRQKAVVVDELNTKYNIINQFLQLEGLDYNDAVKRYEDEFDRNVKMYDVILGQQREARSALQQVQDTARANLQIFTNAATSGSITYNTLSSDQKLMINKLEMQSGLPIGFISSIRKDPKSDIVFTSSNEGVTQVGMRNADGTISVQSYGTRTPSAGSVTQQTETRKRTAFSEMGSILDKLGGTDRIVSTDQWADAKSQWVRQGYEAKDFDAAFRSLHTNPEWGVYAE